MKCVYVNHVNYLSGHRRLNSPKRERQRRPCSQSKNNRKNAGISVPLKQNQMRWNNWIDGDVARRYACASIVNTQNTIISMNQAHLCLRSYCGFSMLALHDAPLRPCTSPKRVGRRFDEKFPAAMCMQWRLGEQPTVRWSHPRTVCTKRLCSNSSRLIS